MQPSRDEVRADGLLIGWITRTGCDNFWTIAEFEAGPSFEKVGDILKSSIKDSPDCGKTIEPTSELEITIGEAHTPVYDFQLTSSSTVEFKEGC